MRAPFRIAKWVILSVRDSFWSSIFPHNHFLKLTSCLPLLASMFILDYWTETAILVQNLWNPFSAVTSFLGLIEAWDYKENKNRSLRRSLKQIRYSKSSCMNENGSNHWSNHISHPFILSRSPCSVERWGWGLQTNVCGARWRKLIFANLLK